MVTAEQLGIDTQIIVPDRRRPRCTLVVAITGRLDGTTVPAAGGTPLFTCRVKTRPDKDDSNETPTERRLDAEATGATRTLLAGSMTPAPDCTEPSAPGS